MRILIGVRFLFAKSLIYKVFSILFNDIRLRGVPETVAAEPFAFSPTTPFNEGLRGVHFRRRGVHILMIPQERKRKAAKPVHPKMRTILRPCSLCSDFDLGSVLENEGNVAFDDLWAVLDEHPIFPSDGFRNNIKKELKQRRKQKATGTGSSFR